MAALLGQRGGVQLRAGGAKAASAIINVGFPARQHPAGLVSCQYGWKSASLPGGAAGQGQSLVITRAAASIALVQPGQPEQQPVDARIAVSFLARCQRVFITLAVCAAWAYLSSGNPASSPFASLALATGEASSSGLQSAAKSAWTGMAAGVLHTLCGPDHLAALTPLTIGRSRVAASALGALWGFGHSTGQLILGLIMVLLKDRFHDFVPALERWSGVIIACTLIAIGAMGIYESHFAKDDEDGHHGHAEQEADAVKVALAGAGGGTVAASRTSLRASLATYATGIIYGLQPDALFVVVPALALPTKAAAVAYCTMFVIGTVLAMGGYTAVIGETSAALTKERPWLQSHLSTIASAIAIVMGILIGLGCL